VTLPPLPADARVLAVDVGGTTLKVEVLDGRSQVLATGVEPTPLGDDALGAVSRLGSRLIDQVEAQGHGPVSRAGLALPGIVDRASGVGVFSANVGWRDLEFGPPLERSWNMPVLVDHDVTIAGWAEWKVGAAQRCDDMFFVGLGTGVAASIVAGGHLLRGGLTQAGELGHVVVRPGGALCGCGNRGCLEAICSASSIARTYASASGRQVDSAADVVSALDDDPVAAHIWDEALSALADGLLNVVNLLSPRIIVLGGGLAGAGDALVKPLSKKMTARARFVPVPDIVCGRFGAQAAVMGAGLLALRGAAED